MSAHAKRTRFPRLAEILDVGAALLLPVVEWLDDLTQWERTAVFIRTGLLVIVAIAAITALAACGPKDSVPGTGSNPSAVHLTSTGTAETR